jgi:hypothetical protein
MSALDFVGAGGFTEGETGDAGEDAGGCAAAGSGTGWPEIGSDGSTVP